MDGLIKQVMRFVGLGVRAKSIQDRLKSHGLLVILFKKRESTSTISFFSLCLLPILPHFSRYARQRDNPDV